MGGKEGGERGRGEEEGKGERRGGGERGGEGENVDECKRCMRVLVQPRISGGRGESQCPTPSV